MTRLADYFVIIGYNHDKEVVNGQGFGKIIQKFPENDWADCPFTQGLELFCQPSGWRLTEQKQEPSFVISVLTDIGAVRHYCACLTFSEDVDQSRVATHQHLISNSHRDEDDDDLESLESASGIIQCATLYAPKSIVLISTLDCFSVFRNCLGIIYAAYVDSINTSFERLIGNILGHVQVPPPGGVQIRFSIGAGDRQCIQPVAYPSVPTTRTSVALLFQQLGIANSLTLFCAAICDQKILFHSKSYSRLTEASHALTALMYPLKYSYVYIPILPFGLLEVLSTPTPFIAGVHESIKPELSELLDVVITDLDEGSLRIPDNTHIPLMPQPMLSRVQHCLQLILRPELSTVDLAFSTSTPKVANLEMQDKEIRAIFLRFFGELFESYRSYLTLVRINPEPVICFHKAMFLGHHGLLENDFARRVLESMSFNAFIHERGPPYRICDIFDEVFASIQDMLKCEQTNPERLLHNIHDLANQLFQNENGTGQSYVQKIPWPTEGAHLRLHQPIFPTIDSSKVTEIIEEGLLKHRLKAKLQPAWQQHPRIIPCASCNTVARDKTYLFSMNVRRLEVLRNCVSFIFDNRISDARKIFPAVLRSLKSHISRLALVEELSFYVNSNRALLDNQQFDLIVRLLNSALQNDSSMDENGIAAAILPLATAFCRKLYTGIIQFAYTCVQEHAVWANLQYWEAAFNQDVQQQICQLYLPTVQETSDQASPREQNRVNLLNVPLNVDNRRSSNSSYNSINSRQKSLSALEIAAEQMRLWPNLSEDQRIELIKNEESTVYSQAIHYANRIVYLRIPLDATKKIKEHNVGLEGESLSSMITNSVAESDSFDAESGFEEQEVNEVGASIAKFATRFVDKVCTDSGVTTEHIKALHQMIPGVIAMHLETLESVLQEIKRLPPIQKPKISFPSLVAGEEKIGDGLRAYLIPDGREEGAGGYMGGPALLPAEGAVFLSTYRIIFKGNSCDPLACEQCICRSFPIASLIKEKKMAAQYFNHIDRWLQEVLQIRSSTFQMMKVAFDEEVSNENVEKMRKLLLQLRNPVSIQMTFAFQGGLQVNKPLHLMTKNKEKNASLRSFAKKTLMKTAKKASIKPKDTNKRGTFIQPTPPLNRKYLSADHYSAATMPIEQLPMFADDLSIIDEHEIKFQIIFDAKKKKVPTATLR